MRTSRTIRNELLILRCRRGDAAAWAELQAIWERRLFYYIRRLVSQEADAWDVLQKTWVQIVRGLGKLRDPASLHVWLYRVARNVAITHHRMASLHDEAPLPDEIVDAENSGWMPRLEQAEQVHRMLERLSPSHREVVTLHFLEGMGVAEIAQVVNAPPGTVKSRLHYAKKSLRAMLAEE